MFYFLSKTIDFLLMPFTIGLLCLISALCTASKTRKRLFVILGLLIFILISNLRLVNMAFNSWELEARDIESLPNTSKVGILLTGGLVNWSTHHIGLGSSADRFMQVYQLYKHKKIQKIVITGTNASWLMKRGQGEGQQVKRWLMDWGVPEKAIFLEEQARNTRENALFTKKILNQNFPNEKFILITSAFHMRRAKGCFNKVGIEVAVFPADYYGADLNFSLRENIIPEAKAAGDFAVLWREWVGYVVYRLMGYC